MSISDENLPDMIDQLAQNLVLCKIHVQYLRQYRATHPA